MGGCSIKHFNQALVGNEERVSFTRGNSRRHIEIMGIGDAADG
jgi:hypothetical protein